MTVEHTQENGDQEQPETPVCPACFRPNPSGADFCQHCGRPMSIIATHGPLEQVYTQGWLYRRGVSGSPRLVPLIGMWLIFGPVLLLMPALVYRYAAEGVPIALALPLVAVFGVPSAIILYRTTRNHVVKRRRQGESEEDLK